MSLIKSTTAPLGSRLRSALATKYGIGGIFSDASCLLLDNSGSMAGRPLDQLNEVADNFKSARRFKFSTTCEEIQGRIDGVGGGTAMDLAFLTVKDAGIKHVVLITDGQPDSEPQALRAAAGLKIDVFYIGPDPAPLFLKKLCDATGGSYGKASIERVAELTARVKEKLAIGAPKSGGIAL